MHFRRNPFWDELSPEFLFHGSIAIPLLEPEALVAFLPAWLLRSMETFDRDSLVLEFTLYFLCPGSPDGGWDELRIAAMVSTFDVAQRSVVGDFLRSVLDCDAMPYWHQFAKHGLKWWSA